METKKNVCVIIRVFNRIDDLCVCIQTIRDYWTRHNYHVVVAANGYAQGYRIPEDHEPLFDTIVRLEENAGHLKGNSQLLMEGIQHIPENTDAVIILEADTWLFDDAVIDKYLARLGKDYLWASAEWVERYHTVGLDFAIIDYHFLRENTAIFDFSLHAEAYVCNYLIDHNAPYTFITEAMPVHRPKSMKRFHNAFGGRFRSFPAIPMVTHHVEDLPGGILQKKELANECAGKVLFPVENSDLKFLQSRRRRLQFLLLFAKILPRSRWIKKKKKREFTQ